MNSSEKMNNNRKPTRKGYLQNAYQSQIESSPDHFSKLDSSVKQDAWLSAVNDSQQEENKLAVLLKRYSRWIIGFLIGALLTGIALAVVTTIWIQNMSSSTSATTTGATTTGATTSIVSTTAAAYWVFGPITNLDPSILLNNGWTQCYNGTYAVNLLPNVTDRILSQCNQGKLLLACKPVANSNYTLAAMGLRSDVLYNCSSNTTCTNVANGVGWYFSDSYSWGFVNGNDSVTRNTCDTGSGNPTLRLCWHTEPYGGYRCGSTTGLNSDTTWERSVWQAN